MKRIKEEEKLERIEQMFKVGRWEHLITTILTLGLVNIYYMMKQIDTIEWVFNKKMSRVGHKIISMVMAITVISFIAQLINSNLSEYFWILLTITWLGLGLHSTSISRKFANYAQIQNNTQQSFNVPAIWIYNVFYINHKFNELVDTQKVRISNEHFYSLPCNEIITNLRLKEKIDAFKKGFKGIKESMTEDDIKRIYKRMSSIEERDSYRPELPWIDILAIKNSLINFRFC